jgi:DNA-binding GntR family transcriptional regulator
MNQIIIVGFGRLKGRTMTMQKKINIMCDCRCVTLVIERDKYGCLNFDFYENMFHTKQNGMIRTIMERLKLAYKILLGKEYMFYDVYVDEKESSRVLEELKEFIDKCESH